MTRTGKSYQSRHWRACALAALLCLGGAAAQADEPVLTAKYNARLSYLPINFATGTLKATLPDSGRYSVDLGAEGIGFAMSGKAVGSVLPTGLSPSSASIDTVDSKEKRSIRMALSGGRVRREQIEPPVPFRPDRVPVTREHRSGVIDPISALMMRAVNSNPLDAGNCNRILPIFEGTERFNITLSYLRTENVKTPKGYEGQALVCRATYKAVAGHRKVPSVAFMENNRTMEAWLVPVRGTDILAPWKVQIGTRVGTMVIEASEFSSSGRNVARARRDVVDSFELRTSR